MESKPRYRLAASMCLALSFSCNANAEINWNGFVTVGGGLADPDNGASSLAGYEEDLTFDNETVLGLQLRAPVSDKLSATGQMVARGSEDYELDMAWAYVSYDATDSTTFRLGRFRTPFYLYSDFLEVGYAYHFIAPPDDVYALPADSVDGFDVVYNTALGSVDTTVQFYGGSIDSSFQQSGQEIGVKIRNQAGLALTFNYDWLTLRASHHEAQKVSFEGLDTLFGDPSTFDATACPDPSSLEGQAALQALGVSSLATALSCLTAYTTDPSWSAAASQLAIDEVKFAFDEIAVKVEWNNLLAVTEFTKLTPDSGPVGEQERMFATLGYTFGAFMVHVTHTKAEDTPAPLSEGLNPALLGALAPFGEGFADGLDQVAIELATPSRTTNTLGLRWDFETGAAFKVEYSDIEDDTGASGNLMRFAVDLVF